MAEGPKSVPVEVIERFWIKMTESNHSFIDGTIVKLGDEHDYIFSMGRFETHSLPPIHAAGCRKCNPEPKLEPVVCSKCK